MPRGRGVATRYERVGLIAPAGFGEYAERVFLCRSLAAPSRAFRARTDAAATSRLVGLSGAGFASRFAPYRTYFLIASAIALAVGFWLAYRHQVDDCGCEVPRRRRAARVGLWITTLLTAAVAVYPLLGSGTSIAGSSEAEAKATLTLKVTGMDCKECTSTIANSIKKVPGVVSATVDFESGNAIVRYDGRGGMTGAAIKAVEDAGYRAEVQP